MSISSSPSALSVMTDREAKTLEKILVKEAKADQKAIDHAMKDVKAAEKALKKCSKTVVKAQKQLVKTKEKETSTAKAVNRAKHKYADMIEVDTSAQDKLALKRATEAETVNSVRQLQSDIDDCQRTMEANAIDREHRLAETRALLGQDVGSDSHVRSSRL